MLGGGGGVRWICVESTICKQNAPKSLKKAPETSDVEVAMVINFRNDVFS